MVKKHYIFAMVSFLSIPVITVLAGVVFNSINPEIAAGHPNYERNYRLLELARHISLVAALLLNMGLWFLTCFFLLESKRQSYVVLFYLLWPICFQVAGHLFKSWGSNDLQNLGRGGK